MKIALFDQVNETHVREALATALTDLGHDVLATGPVWQGHRFAQRPEEVVRIEEALEEVLAFGCEALFNFRASALSPAQIARLKNGGIITSVWLPDDPVLYDVTYRHVIDGYDHVLHCGALRILEFYSCQGHRAGVNFPFWIDPARWTRTWEPDRVQRDLVFIGNLHAPAKRSRYERIAAASERISVYGICPADPLGMHVGELHGVDALRTVLPLFRAGLNLPQRFGEYAGSAYDFAGLAALGGFELPSRVLQYASLGLPVITLDEKPSERFFPHSLHAPDMQAAMGLVDGLATDTEAALDLSLRARADVESYFSAMSRARFLMALFSGEIDIASMPLEGRANCYRNFQGNRH